MLDALQAPALTFAWFLYEMFFGMFVASAIELWDRNNHGLGEYERESSGYTCFGMCALIFVIGSLGLPSLVAWHYSIVHQAFVSPNDDTFILLMWNIGCLVMATIIASGFHPVIKRSHDEMWDQIEPVSE